MDLISGYHQMPLHADSRQYTAFKTAYGLWEWLRVPLWLRNAAAHFQQCMATEVLNGLVNVDCALYLDDVLVHARTEEQFLERLTKILERFEKRGLVLSPSKCSFGMGEVEILGHTITTKVATSLERNSTQFSNSSYHLTVHRCTPFLDYATTTDVASPMCGDLPCCR